ncbi:right-handed parallel beta-helix repeat-containing protein [Oryzibacter oryziterrae]|uniref:right-handed parallel beta-helix repeat-containing protein n=1 Tax=Oryzibacter oryziterrae TaxID=2766474 RepID=UPI001F2BB481|nr:right-handed parallel beta-helix repeat-containing protein [Oryzibacter oryziterrae]
MSGLIGSSCTTAALALSAGLVCFATSSPAAAQTAPTCSAEQTAELLAQATADSPSVQVTCSPVLKRDDVITKQLRFEGAAASGIDFKCNGATIDGTATDVNKNKTMITIQAIGKDWMEMSQNRPSKITIRDCRLLGSARVSGLGANGQGELLKASSREPGHTERTQAAAPSQIQFVHIDFQATGHIPLYLSPGATQVSVTQSRFGGMSNSTMIYLDAETAHNRILDNEFNGRTTREYIAVDASAKNEISDNSFVDPKKGGIFVYRNCGEGGVIRQQAPQNNAFNGNTFLYKSPMTPDKPGIWLGSRTGYNFGFRSYCISTGSVLTAALPPDDDAHKNSVTGNVFVGASPTEAIRDYGADNTVADNVGRQ